jgi:DNA-directed RNA polymerase specialized sigma24 family protein
MTGYTDQIRIYNKWFTGHHKELQQYCRKYRIPEDYIGDAYIKVHDRITRSGFTETYFKTYLLKTICNLRLNDQKKNNKKYFVDVAEVSREVEREYERLDYTDKDDKRYQEDVLYFSRMIFVYIMNIKQYPAEWQTVFRSYYLMPGRVTYKKLHTMTGYNKNHCTKIITTIKKDIRTNFLTWLKDQKGQKV